MTHVPDADTVLDLYRQMRRIRRFEETASELLAAGRIPGFIHLSIGQEAVAVGVCDALTDDDHIASTHRGHGHCIAKGGRLDRMMAELFGKPDGYCRGRSGSMHIADPSIGILGANAIVAGGLPMTVGAALSSQIQGDGRVAVAFFGEGAVAEGVFHECLNLAALWRLPVVFVCENNQYAELTHVSLHLAAKQVVDFAAGYQVPAVQVDGNDVLAVRDAAADAVARARAGQGPTLLECATYRWRGHFEGDPERYRDRAEVEQWQERDPLVLLRSHAHDGLDVADAQFADVDAEVDAEVEVAVAWAGALPDPELDLLTADVYHDLVAAPPGGR